jgi:hypothetical protein
MSGAYFSGNQTVSDFVANTQQELSDALKTAFLGASWTLEFEDSTERELRSAASSVSTNRCRVRLIETGGNCLNITLRTDDAVKVSQAMYLLPGRTFKAFINQYQYFILAPTQFIARTFVAGGAVHIPTHHQGIISNALWAHGNGSSDTDVVNDFCSFREKLSVEGGGQAWQCVNHVLHPTQAWSGGGGQRLICQAGATGHGVFSGGLNSSGYTWGDGTPFKSAAWIEWPPASGDPQKAMGFLWDALTVTDNLNEDTKHVIGGIQYWNITLGRVTPNWENLVFPGCLLLYHP